MNKTIYLVLSKLEISKTLIYEFWCYYIKLKYHQNVKLCCKDTGSFTMHINIKDVYEHIPHDVKTRFYIANYENDRPLLTGNNKKVIGLMKKEIVGKIVTEFVGLRPKGYSYLTDNRNSDKKAKGTKKICNKKK